jgi:dihydroflavonol-4-reductase
MVVRQAVKEGLDAVIICPTGMVSPFDFRPSFFGQVLLALCQKRLPVLVAGGFNWVDVRDVAKGALQAEGHAPIGSR